MYMEKTDESLGSACRLWTCLALQLNSDLDNGTYVIMYYVSYSRFNVFKLNNYKASAAGDGVNWAPWGFNVFVFPKPASEFLPWLRNLTLAHAVHAWSDQDLASNAFM